MIKRGQIEDIIIFFAIILIILSGLVYYFYFRTGEVPILKLRQDIRPAEKGVVPPGTFFPKPKDKKLPFIFLNVGFAQVLKPNIGLPLRPNRNIETFISYPYKNLIDIEDYKIRFKLSGKNLKNPADKFYFAYLLLPINKDWQILKSTDLILTLPKKQQYYLILVSAVNSKNEYDPTPLGLIFRTNISSYFQDVRISKLSQGVIIKLKNISQKEISVTNWRIISSLGNFLIPQAVEFVDPYRFYKRENIILKPGEELKIIASSSPLGINFKGNKCFDYLLKENYNLRNFFENTNIWCEKLSKEELLELRKLGYSLNCILTLERAGCTGPKGVELQKIRNDIGCLNLIYSRWNYQSCYENRKNDEDFLLPIWYIFLPVKKLYFPRYEEIRLFDEKGFLVDKYLIY